MMPGMALIIACLKRAVKQSKWHQPDLCDVNRIDYHKQVGD